jgi:hypothetical protein
MSKREEGPTEHVAVRLSPATVARLEALRPHYSTKYHAATRSDMLRMLVLLALDIAEKQIAKDKKPDIETPEAKPPRKKARPTT